MPAGIKQCVFGVCGIDGSTPNPCEIQAIISGVVLPVGCGLYFNGGFGPIYAQVTSGNINGTFCLKPILDPVFGTVLYYAAALLNPVIFRIAGAFDLDCSTPHTILVLRRLVFTFSLSPNLFHFGLNTASGSFSAGPGVGFSTNGSIDSHCAFDGTYSNGFIFGTGGGAANYSPGGVVTLTKDGC